MKTRILGLSVVAILGLATVGSTVADGTAVAQPPMRQRVKGKANWVSEAMPKSVTPAMRQQLTLNADQGARDEDDAQQKEEAADVRAMERTLQPERTALKRVLDKSPFFAQYQAEVKTILEDPKLTDDQRTEALRAAEARHRPAYERALGEAGVSIPAVRQKLKSVSPDLEMDDNFIVMRRPKSKVRPLSGGNGSRTGSPDSVAPSVTTLELGKPFGLEQDDLSRDGITLAGSSEADARAATGRCTARVSVGAGVGWGNGVAAVGHIIEVPAGVKRIEVTAKANRFYYLTATSVGAISRAKAKGYLEITGVSGGTVTDREDFGTVTAPLFWSSHKQGDADPITFFTAMNVPPQGGTFQIRLRVQSDVFNWGLGGLAYASSTATCESMQVRMIR